MADKEIRDRVRALVKQVLESVPLEDEKTPAAQTENFPQKIVVNSLKEKLEKEFDRDESAKNLLTEDDLRGLEDGARVRVAENVKFTSLAQDIVNDKKLVLVTKSSRNASLKVKSVAVGCDHGGFEYKEELKSFLSELGVNVRDFGTNSKDSVDYPDFAHAVAEAVGRNHVDVGVIIDGAGIGSAMAANKVPNVRAAACYSVALAKNSREHNGANILTLGSGQNSFTEIKEIVEAFLTNEITEERHKKRVGKIDAIEKQYKN
ncbi:MAG: RpiB/LacA/LacB family sugar-phosphate isomerase [Pyrinomonadaceae bacterium]